VPALAVEVGEVLSPVDSRIESGRHHHEYLGAKPTSPHPHPQLPNRELIGQLGIDLLIHPSGLVGLTPRHDVILTAQALTSTKSRCAPMMLTSHIVDPLSLQPREGPVRAVIAGGSDDIAGWHRMLLLSKQGQFTSLCALITSHAQRRQRPTGQVKDRDQASNRKAHTRLVATRLGRGLLIGLGVGHGHG